MDEKVAVLEEALEEKGKLEREVHLFLTIIGIFFTFPAPGSFSRKVRSRKFIEFDPQELTINLTQVTSSSTLISDHEESNTDRNTLPLFLWLRILLQENAVSSNL